jgi:predicted acetyltransferase
LQEAKVKYNLKYMDEFKFKVFDEVPPELVEQVDKLLEEDGSNNRIQNTQSLKEYSKERYCSEGDRFKYIIVLDQNKVIGIILVLKREINFKGQKILVGGISGVGTKEEYRGQGIATKMLSMVGDILKEAGCDMAFLNTDIDDPVLVKIYQRIGFVLLGRSHTYTGRSGKRYFDNDGMIAPINSQEKFEEVLKDSKPFDLGHGVW